MWEGGAMNARAWAGGGWPCTRGRNPRTLPPLPPPPKDAVQEPLLAVLGGVRPIDVQRLEHGVRQMLLLDVLLHGHMP